jgi:hypothetical protein
MMTRYDYDERPHMSDIIETLAVYKKFLETKRKIHTKISSA